MLEMTIPVLSLPLSPTFSLYYSWCRAGQRSDAPAGFVTVTKIPSAPVFLPGDVLVLQLDCVTTHLRLLFEEKEVEGGGYVDVCSRVTVLIIHNLPFFRFILKHAAVPFDHNNTRQLFTFELYMAHIL